MEYTGVNRGFQLLESINTTHITTTDSFVASYRGTHQESLHMLIGYFLGQSQVLAGHGLLWCTTATGFHHTAHCT